MSIDLTCGLVIEEIDDAFEFIVAGGAIYFCSARCRQKFVLSVASARRSGPPDLEVLWSLASPSPDATFDSR